MIKAKTKKVSEYYKAVITVTSGDYKKSYYSTDMFLSKKTALKHAKHWCNECLEVGYITEC